MTEKSRVRIEMSKREFKTLLTVISQANMKLEMGKEVSDMKIWAKRHGLSEKALYEIGILTDDFSAFIEND